MQNEKTCWWVLAISTACQAATIAITWPLWSVRDAPPNLPAVELPESPWGVLLFATLFVVVLLPRFGVFAHCLVLGLSMLADEYRFQPQLWTLAGMMLAAVSDDARRFMRWQMPALWIWTAVHKTLSPDWWCVHSGSMFGPLIGSDVLVIVGVALAVTAAELLTGVVALVRPKWLRVLCPAMHAGIFCFLLIRGWNYSVLPWNFAMCLCGAWLCCYRGKSRSWEWLAACVLFVVPIGFYVGWVDHTAAHVLYSGGTPTAKIWRGDRCRGVDQWGELAVPFPSEQRHFLRYFERTAKVGEMLVIEDQRGFVSGGRFVMRGGRAVRVR